MEEGVVEDGVVAGAADLVVAAEVQAAVEVGFQDPDRLQIPDHPLAQVSIATVSPLTPPTHYNLVSRRDGRQVQLPQAAVVQRRI